MCEWEDAGWKLVWVGGSWLKVSGSELKMSGSGWERVVARFSITLLDICFCVSFDFYCQK